jgi:adhesin transport system membrane fusion protein
MSTLADPITAHMAQATKGPSRLIRLSALAVGVFLVWAAFAGLDEIASGRGEIVPTNKPQVIQSLEGGILADLAVNEGQRVEKGQILARLHAAIFQSAVSDLQEQLTALDIRRLRLEAEMAGQTSFDVPPAYLEQAEKTVLSERALLTARQDDHQARLKGTTGIVEETKSELAMLEKMLKRNLVPEIEVTKVRRTLAEHRLRLAETKSERDLDIANQYAETLQKLNSIREQLKGRQDQLTRTTLTSPITGIVNQVSISTIGGVVTPGEEILQIIPLDEELFVEAKIAPRDIANIRTGQDVTVKLSAYDYSIYGSLKGTVALVSADTLVDERSRDQQPYYLIRVALEPLKTEGRQAEIEMRPGMIADVEVQVGNKTLLQYLLKPLYKSREAFRER